MQLYKTYPALLLIALGILAGCSKKDPAAAPTGAAPSSGAPGAPKTATYNVSAVDGFIVKSSALSESVTASGSILPSEETELHAETSGRVVTINLPEGRSVQKGELLIKINDEDLQTQVRRLDTQLKQAQITEQRLGELLKVKGVSQQEYDLAVLAVQNLRNEIDLVQVNIRKTELRAPYSGVLGLRRISPGAYITPATAIATIRASGGLKLDFSVPERYSNIIKIGQSIQFTVEGNAKPYSAKIIATDQQIAEGTRDLLVRAAVQDTKGLLPGSFAEVALNLNQKSQAMMIPSQAIIPQARDKKVFVSRNGKAVSVTVKTGVRQSTLIEITDGLQIGDTVAITGMLFLRPDVPLKFSKVE